jgi:hypothetical protein
LFLGRIDTVQLVFGELFIALALALTLHWLQYQRLGPSYSGPPTSRFATGKKKEARKTIYILQKENKSFHSFSQTLKRISSPTSQDLQEYGIGFSTSIY